MRLPKLTPHRRSITTLALSAAGIGAILLSAGFAPVRAATFHVGLAMASPGRVPNSQFVAYWGEPDWTMEQMAADPAIRANGAAYRARLLAAASGNRAKARLQAPDLENGDISGSVAVAFAALEGVRPGAGVIDRTPWTPRLRVQRASYWVPALPRRPVEASASVTRAIVSAAELTGVAADYLFRVGQRESSLDPYAGARTSSARGLYQFVEGTWLLTVKRYGRLHGLEAAASMIRVDGYGRPFVADPVTRRQILALRYDPQLNAVLAAEHTRENAQALRGVLGRDPFAGELYAAHVLGSAGASRLVRTVRTAPATPAYALFPDAARSNKNLFYINGLPRSAAGLAAELYRRGET